MGALIDIVGMRFGHWTVLARHPERNRTGAVYWLCRCDCDCGTERIVRGAALHAGTTTSCGCWRREVVIKRNTKHGHARRGQTTRAYTAWKSMMQRCYDPNATAYANYGGRGIGVCARWHHFPNYYADVGDAPPGKSLDRVNNDGDYELSNVRWASRSEQMLNRRRRKRKRRRAPVSELLAYTNALARAGGREESIL
jgi:hypothetical protein